MKKYLLLVSVLFLSIFLSACTDDGNKEANKEMETRLADISKLNDYMTTAKEMSSSIYSNSSFKELENYFNSKKDVIDEELFTSTFDLSNEHNIYYYQHLQTIDSIENVRSFADYVQEKDTVSIVLVSLLHYKMDAHSIDETMLNLDGIHSEKTVEPITEVYTFDRKTNKLVNYTNYE